MVRRNELVAVEWLSPRDPGCEWIAEALHLVGSRTKARREIAKVAHLRFKDGRSILVVEPCHAAAAQVDLRKLFGLTSREGQVAQLLLERLTNKEIAASLGVTQHTAWRHTEKVIAKSGCGSRRNLESVVRESMGSGR